MIKIIDNFLEKNLIQFLEHFFLHNTPHYFTGASKDINGKKFYYSPLNINDLMVSFLIKKLKNKFNFKQIISTYLNIQHYKMDGDWHKDPGNNTLLLMITKTLKKGSGQFQIKYQNKEINKIDFIQNRLIIFDATKFHRGLAPKEINIPRITLVFKTI